MSGPAVLHNINQPREISQVRNIRPSDTKPTEECFDDLQVTCEKTLALLKDRHHGLASWNSLMKDNVLDLKICLHNLGVDISPRA